VTVRQALRFVEREGAVMETARGPLACLLEELTGAPIRGSWWAHPRAGELHAVTRVVRACPEVLVCRLAGGKVTLIHRRLWPALVRLAHELPRERLAAVREVHTSRGHHEVRLTPFPRWVPREVARAATGLRRAEAAAALRALLQRV
jgi:hypothetical protein